jgi:hypothetical protein
MDLIYLAKSPLGEVFYDPASKRGVAVSVPIPTSFEMKPDFDPSTQSNARRLEVDDRVFHDLTSALELGLPGVIEVIAKYDLRTLILSSKPVRSN